MEVEEMRELETLVESHEKRLNAQEQRITNQSKRLDEHEKRLIQDDEAIKQLKDDDVDKHERLNELEENYENLSRTVTRENEETRHTMRDQTGRLFDLVEKSMGHQATRTSQQHEIKKERLNTFSTIFLKLTGGLVGLLSSGGIIYLLTEKLLSN